MVPDRDEEKNTMTGEWYKLSYISRMYAHAKGWLIFKGMDGDQIRRLLFPEHRERI